MFSKPVSWLLLFIFTLLLAACFLQATYRYADVIIGWLIKDYVSWTKPQEEYYDQRINELLDWHQQTQLSLYKQWLVELKTLIGVHEQKEVDPVVLRDHFRNLEGFWSSMAEQSFPAATYLLSSLNDEQVNKMIRVMNKKKNEQVSKFEKEDEPKRKKRLEKSVDKTAGRWIGKLTNEQRLLVDGWFTNHIDTRELWQANRTHWINTFADALKNRQQPDFQQRLHTLWVDQASLYSQAYTDTWDKNLANGFVLVADILNTRTTRQDEVLQKAFNKWIKVCEDLMKDPGTDIYEEGEWNLSTYLP